MGYIDILLSDILSCFIALRVSVTFIKYSLKHSILRFSFHNISPFSTIMIFRLASLSENNDLTVINQISLLSILFVIVSLFSIWFSL